MLKTIRVVANGEAIFEPAIATRLTSFFQGFDQEPSSTEDAPPFPDLTSRERDVLELVQSGGNLHNVIMLSAPDCLSIALQPIT